jgi:hypothetical protein
MPSYITRPSSESGFRLPQKPPLLIQDAPFFNTCFDKTHVKNLVSWFLNSYGEKQTIDFLESLKYVGFHQATLAGISLGIEDLEIPPDKPVLISEAHVTNSQIDQQNAAGLLTSVEKSQCLIDNWNQTSDFLRVSAIQNFRTRNSVNPVYMMAFSGARGNVSQVRQLVAMRGLMADPQGAILEFPIQSNFREGLTITEYLISCYGARKGLVDTALRTATSGYLTRRLVDSAQHAVIAMLDCGTDRGILIEGQAVEKRLIGRVLAEALTNKNHIPFARNFVISADAAKLIGLFHTQVRIRSPLTCDASTSICQLCYGWNLASSKMVHIGEAVGVIAAQSIGEPGTQLTMRTFHTGGVGVLSDQALKQIIAPYKGKILFKESFTGRFIRTPHGRIAYMVKYTNQDPNRLLFQIQGLEQTQRQFIIREQEFPSGSLLFVKHGELVDTHQLIAQASHVRLTKQILPESSHPVYSPLDGQVFFESMPLLIRKEVLTPNDKTKKNTDNSEKKPIKLPEVRTMSKIGSFWVFSGHNQHETHISRCFAEPGDLISSQSILFDYHFYSSAQVQIRKIERQVGFGVSVFQIPISTVCFVRSTYKCITKKESLEKLIYQPQGQLPPFVIWYPCFFENNSAPLQESDNRQLLAKNPRIKTRLILKKRSRSNLVYTYLSSLYLQATFMTTDGFSEQVSEYDNENVISSLAKGLTFGQSSKGNEFALPKGNFFILNTTENPIIQRKLNNQFFNINNGPKFYKNIKSLFREKFIKTALTQVQISSLSQRNQTGFHRKSGWVYIPGSKTSLDFEILNYLKDTPAQLKRHFIPTGVCIEDICFPKHHIMFDVIPRTIIHFRSKNKLRITKKEVGWYDEKIILTPLLAKNYSHTSSFSKSKIQTTSSVLDSLHFSLKSTKKKGQTIGEQKRSQLISGLFGLIWYTRFNKNYSSASSLNKVIYASDQKDSLLNKDRKTSATEIILKIRRQVRHSINLSQGLKFQLAREYSLFETNAFQQKWTKYIGHSCFGPEGRVGFLCTLNPLITKQTQTKFQYQSKAKIKFQMEIPTRCCWAFEENLTRIRYSILKEKAFPKLKTRYQKLSNTNARGLDVFVYQFGALKNAINLSLQTYSNNWILPSHVFSKGCVKAGTAGEFRYKNKKTNGTFINTLRHKDLLTLKLEKKIDITRLSVGQIIRWGNEISPGIASIYNGQLLKHTPTSLTLRIGVPILASARGVVHVFNRELITKNQILMTLKSRRLQTEDIVQGIPKIEQLFEARESQGGQVLQDTVHTRLRNAFVRELESPTYALAGIRPLEHRAAAVETSFLEAQRFLVENIVDAYANQGVKISEKHVEVIARQMTSRVRILDGGETGLIPGELVQYRWLQKFNKHICEIGLSEASYEPIILGISKSVLQSDSFLLAASFQEVSRVLVRSALSKKRDFLRGLHENVIVGQLIPAGTGLVSQGSVIPLSNKSSISEGYLQ